MNRRLASFALAVLFCAGAHAAVISTTLTVTNATGSIGTTAITFTGPATLTNNVGNGTFSGTLNLTSTAPGTFTITLVTGGTITGTFTVPASALAGGPLTGSLLVTGGTGTYAGATGNFPSLTGTASVGISGFTMTFSAAGTINTGGSVGPPVPTITDVLDAGSYTKNIAQGSIFVVKGSNLSASGYVAMSFPLPTNSGNVRITFAPVTGGAGTDAYLVYLYNQGGVNQLAALLPSTLAIGNYNVTVNYNGTASAPFAVQVVQRKLGLITANGGGSGLAVVQNYISAAQLDIDRFTTFSSSGFTFSPSRPGQVLIAWAVGMGPVTGGGENNASPGFNFSPGVNVQVIVGGMNITPSYAGRAPGLAGADQINFTLPANVPTGCTVSFQVSVAGVLSNSTFIAIAPDGGSSACVQPGFTTDQLSQFDQGASRTTGSFSLGQFSETVAQLGTIKINSANGQFVRYTGFQLDALAQQQSQVSTSGACTVIHSTVTAGSTSSSAVTGLDAGSVTLTGPSGSNLSNTAFTEDPKTYNYSINLGTEGFSLPGSVNASLVAGNYTVNGAGGKDIGRFSASVSLGAPLTITGGLPATVVRSAGLPLNWTGGNASDLVEIVGSTSSTTGTGANQITDSWVFICTTNAGARTFTVPPSILTQLPAAASGVSLLEVVSGATANFTAPLVAGGNIDAGTFIGLVGIGASPAYQ